jgi:hypothetical protein
MDQCCVLITKNLRQFRFRAICRIRSKGKVEARIEHADDRHVTSDDDHIDR